jgi:predicted DNA-binding transcriptional regulator AlpA
MPSETASEALAKTTLLTFAEVAHRIGLSTRGLRKMIAAGRFGPRVLHVGSRSLRILESELAEWIALNCPGRDEFAARRGGRS